MSTFRMMVATFFLLCVVYHNSLGAAPSSSSERESWDELCMANREERVVLLKSLSRPDGVKQTLRLNLRRIRNEGRPPVILTHAVVLTNLAMRNIGHYLWENGFDVWMPNMRGHGNGDERSTVFPYYAGDYAFDNIVVQDWPLVMEHVLAETGQKVSLVGFSMGGMTWEQYLNGVYRGNDGSIRQSEDMARKRAGGVQNYIGLVAPQGFEHVNQKIKDLLYPLLPYFERHHVFIPFSADDSPGTENDSWMVRVRNKIFRKLTWNLPFIFPEGIIHKAIYGERSRAEFSNFATNLISSPHTDYVSDVVRWFYADYASRDGNVNYGTSKLVQVPSLLISAAEDQLASPDQIAARAKLFPEQAKVKVVRLENMSHLDVAFKDALPHVGKLIASFLQEGGVD